MGDTYRYLSFSFENHDDKLTEKGNIKSKNQNCELSEISNFFPVIKRGIVPILTE